MVEIRAAWDDAVQLNGFVEPQLNELLSVERDIADATNTCLDIAALFADQDELSESRSLHSTARGDLVAGCELARSGYFKQAYSLWRSWYEQSIFALYFLEAPLYRQAWRVSSEVGLDDKPRYRLMLHQLLAESEPHPFALMYSERFETLMQTLKISQISKSRRPMKRSANILTMLSQGVHGTYRPLPVQSLQMCCQLMERHCTPILKHAADSVAEFWILYLVNQLDFPPALLIKMKQDPVTADELQAAGMDDAATLARISSVFKRAVAVQP
jgi:hypothetical protein